jgi:hypothetical protein
LGLAEHRVGDGKCALWLPIDTEVHVGSDNRMYLIDLARLMPPVPPPAPDTLNSYLYCHFRPEFLQRHPEFKLSSDTFSKFAADGKLLAVDGDSTETEGTLDFLVTCDANP